MKFPNNPKWILAICFGRIEAILSRNYGQIIGEISKQIFGKFSKKKNNRNTEEILARIFRGIPKEIPRGSLWEIPGAVPLCFLVGIPRIFFQRYPQKYILEYL